MAFPPIDKNYPIRPVPTAPVAEREEEGVARAVPDTAFARAAGNPDNIKPIRPLADREISEGIARAAPADAMGGIFRRTVAPTAPLVGIEEGRGAAVAVPPAVADAPLARIRELEEAIPAAREAYREALRSNILVLDSLIKRLGPSFGLTQRERSSLDMNRKVPMTTLEAFYPRVNIYVACRTMVPSNSMEGALRTMQVDEWSNREVGRINEARTNLQELEAEYTTLTGRAL